MTHFLMILVDFGVFSLMLTDPRTDPRTDGPTDGQTLIKRCEDASKNKGLFKKSVS